ncbi:MAG: hypothetical protein KGM24_08355, partial [Elusimicrobia bacterium]|nr:hypothetical protein [Elusimicrobiota bacterium]
MRGSRHAAAVLFAVLAVADLGLGARLCASWAPRARALADASQAELGEALIARAHSRSADPSFRMPLVPLLESDALLRLSPREAAAAAAGLALLTAWLVFALGLELGGAWSGLAAAAVWQVLFALEPKIPGFAKQFVLTPLVLLAALALVRRARRPGAASSALAGAAIGASLLSRGVLAFLPPLLAAGELRGPGRPRARAARAGLLLLACALLLSPWWIMNAVVQRRFVPLENGAADLNVALGALGVVHGGDGNALALTGGKPVLPWAARRVFSRPGPFLRGVAARLRFALSLRLWLFALAALALLLRRRDPAVRAVALLAAYWLAISVLMPVEPDYFDPLWPLLAALAAAPLAALP